ncbi:uncharacterized protein LOC121430448 [Lytechinus variegatus]|uniref:uncharacterized protein LOC121430448 n=1 Tax=Lytechinus variegatus TaxID=7654 RepID=UPI001BB1553A|nr:uncharacterized protein LOC121430448 [Lytechinus variegatus]
MMRRLRKCMIIIFGILPSIITTNSATIEYLNLDHCDVTYVTSPNYPDNYDNNINMTWMVTAPLGYRVVLRFMVLVIEVNHDYVTVFDGWTPVFEGAVQRLHISGSTPPRYNLTSVGSYLWLRFTSDVELTREGFRALLSCIPIPVVDLSLIESSNLSSPFYPEQYNDNTDLLWKVTAPTGFRVVLTFAAFNTENDHDFVTLFEGRSTFFNESSLRKTLSGTPRLGKYKSIGSHLWIRFTSDDNTVLHSSSSKGFQALLSYTTAQVSEVLLVDSETIHNVTSPNYPDSYAGYDDILWRITAPENYRVLLHFKDFNTGDQDNVTIYEGRGPNIEESTWRSRNSGHGSQHNITSIGSYLWIRFISERNDNIDGADGFRLMVYPIPIPDIQLTSIKAVNLSSPKYPGLYDTNTDIIWRVIAPSGSKVVISFIDFHTKQGSDFLTIYEGLTGDFEGAVQGFRLSGESSPDITSTGSYVWLRFTTGSEIDSCVSCSGFMATLQAIQGCEIQSTLLSSPDAEAPTLKTTSETNLQPNIIVIASVVSSFILLLVGSVPFTLFMCHRKRIKTEDSHVPDTESADHMYRNPVYSSNNESKDCIPCSRSLELHLSPSELSQSVTSIAGVADEDDFNLDSKRNKLEDTAYSTYCSISDLPESDQPASLLPKVDLPENTYEAFAEGALPNDAANDEVKSRDSVTTLITEVAPEKLRLTEDGYEKCIVENNKIDSSPLEDAFRGMLERKLLPDREAHCEFYTDSDTGFNQVNIRSIAQSPVQRNTPTDDGQYLEVNVYTPTVLVRTSISNAEEDDLPDVSQAPITCIKLHADPATRRVTEDGYEECIVNNTGDVSKHLVDITDATNDTESGETSSTLQMQYKYDSYRGNYNDNGYDQPRAVGSLQAKSPEDYKNDDQYLDVNIPIQSIRNSTSSANSAASLCREEEYNILDFTRSCPSLRYLSNSQISLSRSEDGNRCNGDTYDVLTHRKTTSPRNSADICLHNDNVYNTLSKVKPQH